MSEVAIALVEYPGAMASAVSGLAEVFHLANRIGARFAETTLPSFSPSRWRADGSAIEPAEAGNGAPEKRPALDIVIVPPCIGGAYYAAPHPPLTEWLRARHAEGAVLCSACAGSFILAETGLLDGRRATTHWGLSSEFAQRFPKVRLDADQVLVNEGDIVTAGGLMSWMDLGLELVERFAGPRVMIELGKWLVVDTGRREQRYYRKFVPHLGHGDAAVVKAQHYIHQHFHSGLTVTALAGHCHFGERTLLRRFLAATGLTPTEYLQNVRVQKARELIETGSLSVEAIAARVGYEDAGAFRKLFKRLTGLSPREFRTRFAARPIAGWRDPGRRERPTGPTRRA